MGAGNTNLLSIVKSLMKRFAVPVLNKYIAIFYYTLLTVGKLEALAHILDEDKTKRNDEIWLVVGSDCTIEGRKKVGKHCEF